MPTSIKPSLARLKNTVGKHLYYKELSCSGYTILIFLILGIAAIAFNHYYKSPYPWVFVNTNEKGLSWIYSAWAAILGVHGTIAALSITFMGMFVNQASDIPNKYFEKICRSLILKNNNFLAFGMDATLGLLTGVVLFVIGGGVIQYAISMALSIYFIISYIMMYLKLYAIMEDKDLIMKNLEHEIKHYEKNKEKTKQQELIKDGIINSLYDSLLLSDEMEMQWCIRNAVSMSPDRYMNIIFTPLFQKIYISTKKDFITHTTLSRFLNELSHQSNKIDNKIHIINNVFKLAEYIYNENDYYLFFQSQRKTIEPFIQFRDKDTDRGNKHLDLYWSILLDAFSCFNYNISFTISKFFTEDAYYIDIDRSYASITATQRKMLNITKESIALLIIRLEFLINKEEKNNVDSEINSILKLIRVWISSGFISNIYFIEESYSCLFSMASDFSRPLIERKLNEIDDNSASTLDAPLFLSKAITILLFPSNYTSGKFSLSYIRNIKKLIRDSHITTHHIKNMISYIDSEEFTKLYSLVYKHDSINFDKRKNKLSNEMIKLNNEIEEVNLREIKEAYIIKKLKNEFEHQFNDYVTNKMNLIADISKDDKENMIRHRFKQQFIISKMPLIKPINGCFHVMDSNLYADAFINLWLSDFIIKSLSKNIHIEKIKDPDSLPDRTTISMLHSCNDYKNIYKFTSNIVINSNDDDIRLPGPGVYYINLTQDFSLETDREICSSHVENITTRNIERIRKNNGDASLLDSSVMCLMNISIEMKENSKIYFLPLNECRELEEYQTEQIKIFQKSS